MTKKSTFGRRKLLGAGLAAGAATALPKTALASPTYDWKMVMTWQKTLPGLGTGAVRLAKRIEQMSGGRIRIKVYGGGELVPAMGVFDAVSEGKAELGHSAPYYWMNKSKAAAFFSGVPAGLTAQEQNAWVYFGGGQQLWDELYAPFNLRGFAAGNTGAQMCGWYNREITSVEDIKGLKIRMPGLGGEIMTRLGASAQTMPPQELFTAMQSGVIDAVEWVGPWNDSALGFQKVGKYYYGPGVQEGGTMFELMVNKTIFDGLPKDLQQVVKVACATENMVMESEFYYNNTRAFGQLRAEMGDRVRTFPESVLKEIVTIAQQVVDEVASTDEISQKIYRSFSEFRKNSIDMAPMAELGFLKARTLGL